jgi:hypothetical protein
MRSVRAAMYPMTLTASMPYASATNTTSMPAFSSSAT